MTVEKARTAGPSAFPEVALEVVQVRVGLADLGGKRDLRAEPAHRGRAVQQRGLQDTGLVLTGRRVIRDERNRPPVLVIRAAELLMVECLSAHNLTIAP